MADTKGYRLEYVPLAELQRWPRNPKKHDEKGIDESLERFGFVNPLVVDETSGKLVAGHGRLEALERRRVSGKEPPLRVAKRGKEWLVPVLRGIAFKDMTEAESFLLADNKLVENGGWDEEMTATILADLAKGAGDFKGLGFELPDLEVHINVGDGAGLGAPPEPEVEEEEPEPPPDLVISVKPGDIFQLGDHRIMCGDSTREEDVDRLVASGSGKVHAVVSDPPYAIYGSSTGIGADISDDKMVRPFFEAIFRMAHRLLPEFGCAYLCTDWRSWAAMWEAAKRERMSPKNCIVWDKGGGGLGSNWANAYELTGYFAKLPPPKSMTSNSKAGQRTVFKANIQRHQRPRGAEREHNAAKPVKLMEQFIDAASDEGMSVLEPFNGSGTTLIACENMKRMCLSMDIEPKWVQVTINRWERVTGKKAVKL
jgi:DNA modification methylase